MEPHGQAGYLERLCEHALGFGARSITVERKDRREYVCASLNGESTRIAVFASSSADARELRGNISAASKKPLRCLLGGQPRLIAVRIPDDSGGETVEVTFDLLPKLDPAVMPAFTAKQGQYLAYIYHYAKMHRHAPAEADLQRFFQVSAPAVHDMLKALQLRGLIERTPGHARSIRLLVKPEFLPRLA